MPSAIVIDDQSVSRLILSELVRSIGDGIEVKTFADPLRSYARIWCISGG